MGESKAITAIKMGGMVCAQILKGPQIVILPFSLAYFGLKTRFFSKLSQNAKFQSLETSPHDFPPAFARVLKPKQAIFAKKFVKNLKNGLEPLAGSYLTVF